MTSPSTDPVEPSLETLVTRNLGADIDEVASIRSALVEDLAAIDRRLEESLHSTYPQLLQAARYAVSTGGKRVRPLLMAATHRALGALSTRPIHSLAAAFQLIHTATLVHDDVIDHSELRRGRPSMPTAFGLPLAIVGGDYLFVRAFELAAEYPQSIILRCGEACAALVEGEVLQQSGRFDLTTGRDHYLRVIERKTAAIVAAALASVAEIAGADPATVAACERYGSALGIAFQIRDDFLDLFGDPDLLGKPLYSDLREGNPTLLTLDAYGTLSGTKQAEFERLFQLRRKSSADLLRLRELTEGTDARSRVAMEAERWAETAAQSIDGMTPGPYRVLLERLAHGVARRDF